MRALDFDYVNNKNNRINTLQIICINYLWNLLIILNHKNLHYKILIAKLLI